MLDLTRPDDVPAEPWPGRYRAATADAACSMRAATEAGCDT